jgi:hypothetical protein
MAWELNGRLSVMKFRSRIKIYHEKLELLKKNTF